MSRANDGEPVVAIRSERYFKLYDYWYFATREGAMLGPFDTREQALRATRDYIEFMQKEAPNAAVQMLRQAA